MSDECPPAEPEVMEPTFWRKNGWTAQIIEFMFTRGAASAWGRGSFLES